MANITFQSGPMQDQAFELEGGSITFGRAADCDVPLDDEAVSGLHARLEQKEDGVWWITDLESSNGTLVNNEVVVAHALQHGDVIRIGVTAILFTSDEGAATAAAPAGAAAEAEPPPPEATTDELAMVQKMRDLGAQIRREIGKVIIGQEEVIEEVLMAMIAGGHALLVGMPGMAKTLLVRTISQVMDLNFKRIQFTPDLMPTDITGTEVLETDRETGEKSFRFIAGPLFCNMLLADEINRTPPKTQAALLEAMQEKRVTVGNKTYKLDAPFFVLATQNPIEQEGTYPLPEAQMDRFMFNIWVDYPKENEEEIVIRSTTGRNTAEPQVVLRKEDLLQLQDIVRKVPVSDHVIKYVVRLVRATRPAGEGVLDFIKQYVHVGAGPRAGQFLILAAKARAVLDGRIHISCRDIQRAAIPVLRHRVLTNFAADAEGLNSMDIVRKLLAAIPQPSEKDYR